MSPNSDPTVLRLFPGASKRLPLHGLYLDAALRPAGTPARPFVYASFVASLDGRISLPDPETGVFKPPRAITNPRDWRLFQELTAAADVLVTTGRYMRDLAAGAAQAALPVSEEPEFADLLEWRREQKLAHQPAVVIVTDTLDVPIPEALLHAQRSVYVATGAAADSARLRSLADQGVGVLTLGGGKRVDGRELIAALAREGFGNIDMTAGAELLNTLLAAGALDRLYLTQALRILGGRAFDTLLKGEVLAPPADFQLRALFHDDAAGNSAGAQLFTVLDRRT